MIHSPKKNQQTTDLSDQVDRQVNRLDLVLNAAAKEFNIRGISSVSIANVAKAVGMSRASLYYYFSSCSDLVYQCYVRSCEVTLHCLKAAGGRDENAIGTLVRFVENMLAEDLPPIAAITDIAYLEANQSDKVQELIQQKNQLLVKIITQGQEQGLIRSCDALIVAKSIFSLLTWTPFASWWFVNLRNDKLMRRRVTSAVIGVILHGFSISKKLPCYQPLDLTVLTKRPARAFDRTEQTDAKRQDILTQASRLFNQKGIDATSLDEIAERVGISKRTIHRLIGNKQELVMACSGRGFLIFNYIRDAMLKFSGSRLDALTYAHHAVARSFLFDELSPLLLLVGLGSLTKKNRRDIQASGLQLSRDYNKVIYDGIKEGSVRDIDVESHGLMLPGLLRWLASDCSAITVEQREKIAGEVANMIAIGVATEAVAC